MFLNRWSGSDSRSSRCLSIICPGRCSTSTVVEARVGHECRSATSRTTDARMASSTVFLKERILLTAAETQCSGDSSRARWSLHSKSKYDFSVKTTFQKTKSENGFSCWVLLHCDAWLAKCSSHLIVCFFFIFVWSRVAIHSQYGRFVSYFYLIIRIKHLKYLKFYPKKLSSKPLHLAANLQPDWEALPVTLLDFGLTTPTTPFRCFTLQLHGHINYKLQSAVVCTAECGGSSSCARQIDTTAAPVHCRPWSDGSDGDTTSSNTRSYCVSGQRPFTQRYFLEKVISSSLPPQDKRRLWTRKYLYFWQHWSSHFRFKTTLSKKRSPPQKKSSFDVSV